MKNQIIITNVRTYTHDNDAYMLIRTNKYIHNVQSDKNVIMLLASTL